jgi:hypothetical protein
MLALLEIPSFLMKNWKLILAAIAAGVFAVFVYSWDHRGQQVAVLGAQNIVLKTDIEVLNKQVEMMQEAQKIAAARAIVIEHDATQFNQIIEEASRAPEKDDAQIAPVLRRGLDSLGKLLQPDTGPR